jgi:hypothetical protein
MSKMAEIHMMKPLIEDALETYSGLNYKSCEDIAITMEIPLEYVEYVVQERWNKLIAEHTYADECADADAIHYGVA